MSKDGPLLGLTVDVAFALLHNDLYMVDCLKPFVV